MSEPLKLHLRVIDVPGYTYRVVALRPSFGVRISNNRFHDTWHLLSDASGAATISRLLWGLSFQRRPGTFVWIGPDHLVPTPFEADPPTPCIFAPTGLTSLDRGLLRPGARVFALTSSGSLVAFPSYGAVSAAKAALEAHVRQLAVELAPQQITVNAIMAGLCRTPALQKIPGAERLAEAAAARNPSGRLTEPDDVARCLVALAGPGTAWLTGNVLRVDGGETIAV